jgi:thiol-disulfide isomerase/thioredoxin
MKKPLVPIVIVLVVLMVGTFAWSKIAPGPYDEFAQCLEDNGAIFWGAFWCENCNEQKRLFSKSAKKLPYTECSAANGQGQLLVCQDAGITGYPTWDFADGSRETGVLTLATLAEKTECELPK